MPTIDPTTGPDFHLINHGSIFVLTPQVTAAKEWVDEHFPESAQQWANGIVIEPRYIGPILDGIDEDGFTIHHI